MRRLLALASNLLLMSLLISLWIEIKQPEPIRLIPTLSGEAEYCLSCHADLDEISPSHPIENFGCVICHGGERLALDADLAHSTMRGGDNPSDLKVVEASCGGGDCHSGNENDQRNHIQRVSTSIQSTYAGAIANLRYSFGAQPDLSAVFGIGAVQDLQTLTGITSLAAYDPAKESNPALQSFGENCLNCHLYAEPMDGAAFARYTGCAACHSPKAGQQEGAGNAVVHTLTTAIPYSQCNTCHNRGNYDLRSMSFMQRADQPVDRLHDYYQPIAQFVRCEWTLDCVDCHTRTEAMGDGDLHAKQTDIQYVQCRSCHGTISDRPRTRTLDDPDDLAFRMASLNPVLDLQLGDTILITDTGEPLWNTRLRTDGAYEMVGKVTGEHFTFRAVADTTCKQKEDEQESRFCHACHSVER